jgi:hypothetical protein
VKPLCIVVVGIDHSIHANINAQAVPNEKSRMFSVADRAKWRRIRQILP